MDGQGVFEVPMSEVGLYLATFCRHVSMQPLGSGGAVSNYVQLRRRSYVRWMVPMMQYLSFGNQTYGLLENP